MVPIKHLCACHKDGRGTPIVDLDFNVQLPQIILNCSLLAALMSHAYLAFWVACIFWSSESPVEAAGWALHAAVCRPSAVNSCILSAEAKLPSMMSGGRCVHVPLPGLFSICCPLQSAKAEPGEVPWRQGYGNWSLPSYRKLPTIVQFTLILNPSIIQICSLTCSVKWVHPGRSSFFQNLLWNGTQLM